MQKRTSGSRADVTRASTAVDNQPLTRDEYLQQNVATQPMSLNSDREAWSHRQRSELLELDGREFTSWTDTYAHCQAYHAQPDDRYGRDVDETPEDLFEVSAHEEEDEPPRSRQDLAGRATNRDPATHLQDPDKLGERDVDRAYDWTPHMDRNMDLHITPDYWKEAYPRILRYLKPDLTLPLAPAG
ncbi:hypothetical protein N7519_004356 [Penicillium mononematosum]|uniref:uncharacterized protein n=1 Tax=Penicillium mononematosum TaxID=268346 RepID=UPI002548B679|nr:uncharacterized protein N7519_004356 [Penicillium mononematosum]KAJ6189448.1 hypothetical protein N7519_004356 [Penicillium mononematosum]